MAVMPDHLRLPPALEGKLAATRAAALERHERSRKAAKARGRTHFPIAPYECSWAYEQEFRRRELIPGNS